MLTAPRMDVGTVLRLHLFLKLMFTAKSRKKLHRRLLLRYDSMPHCSRLQIISAEKEARLNELGFKWSDKPGRTWEESYITAIWFSCGEGRRTRERSAA